jgi:hypothetical protein
MVACNGPVLQDKEGNEKEKIADAVLGKVACRMKQEASLRPCGTMGQMMNEIQKLGLSFFYFQPVDIVEGRKLLIKAVDALLNEMNQDTRIRPYLGRHPMRPWNVEIEIFLRSPDGSDSPRDSLRVMDVSDGVLTYQIQSSTGHGLITVYEETYQEALDRLANPSLPPAPFKPRPELSAEEWSRLRKDIRYLSDDGSIYHLGENGGWVKSQHD